MMVLEAANHERGIRPCTWSPLSTTEQLLQARSTTYLEPSAETETVTEHVGSSYLGPTQQHGAYQPGLAILRAATTAVRGVPEGTTAFRG